MSDTPDPVPPPPVRPGPGDGAASAADLIARDAAHHSGLWAPRHAFVRGEGVTLIDADGHRYLDLMAGIAVASLGHAHPRLAAAVGEQARRLITAPQNQANDVRTAMLERLFELAPAPLERAFLSNSGSEANEAALKWARAATGRSTFVATRRGFSGRTLGVLPLTWNAAYREPFEPLGYAGRFVPYGDVEALDAAMGDDVAGIVVEPVQGEGGIHPADPTFLQAARRAADAHGALLIFDEVQAGAGRTGTFLAHEAAGVPADVATMAKGLGGGVPIGATLMTAEVAAAMPKGGHGTTFGGNPLAAAAALVVLDELAGGLMEHVREVGAHLRARLDALAADERRIREVRGVGLMLGIEFKEKVAPILAALEARGVLAINAGATVLRMVPPLILTRDDADRAVDALAGALADTAPTP